MVVQKTTCWLKMAAPSGVQYAAAAAPSTVKQVQPHMQQLQSDDATLSHCCCMCERAIFHVSAMLLIYTYSLLPVER